MDQVNVDVFIAGSGPIGCTYARIILEKHPTATIYMAEIGSQDTPVPGGHHKNAVKYQKDIDAFVHVIQGALQPLSVPAEETHQGTLGGNAWRPEDYERKVTENGTIVPTGKVLIYQGRNPNQDSTLNLRASAVTRTVGGMSTHWTANCPKPEESQERLVGQQFVPATEFEPLIKKAGELININPNEYDNAIRHTVVRDALQKSLPDTRKPTLANLDLAVKRRTDNPDFVTWSSASTVLGAYAQNTRFQLHTEKRVTKLVPAAGNSSSVGGVIVHNLNDEKDIFVKAKAYVIACNSVCTPQILWNSAILVNPHDPTTAAWNNLIRPPALGRYLCEQSLAFCQIVLSRDIVEAIPNNPAFKQRVEDHLKKHPQDPIPIPFNDPEPQLTLRYTPQYPWHVQIHRDAFSYGDVGPRADSRVVVDLRWFGRSEINANNRVVFGDHASQSWIAGVTDIYGMPQPTFLFEPSRADRQRDQKMMEEMCEVATMLGGYVPGSSPVFMEPGLALHITGTTRMGNQTSTSVVNSESKVHNIDNLWLGGLNVIPDSTASNPTLTAMAYAIKSAQAIVGSI